MLSQERQAQRNVGVTLFRRGVAFRRIELYGGDEGQGGDGHFLFRTRDPSSLSSHAF